MTQNRPHLFLKRLIVVTNSGKIAYDEPFHTGVNIIRGRNSSGKSTISNFIFYIFGGAFNNWTANHELIMVSISLVKGINFDNLRSVLKRKLEDPNKKFTATISFLNPNKSYLMEALSSSFEKSKGQIENEIRDGVDTIKLFKSRLSKDAQGKLILKFHNTIPFGSAIILDPETGNGRIQIETKAYQSPMGKSFGYEVIPIKKEGHYHTLLEGYKMLLDDGELIL